MLLAEQRDDMLVRLPGREGVDSAGAGPPNEFLPCERRGAGVTGVSSLVELLATLPFDRFLLLRTVTDDGMNGWLIAELVRGDARGGVSTGAGSRDRADCTRSSSFCIFPIRPRIW